MCVVNCQVSNLLYRIIFIQIALSIFLFNIQLKLTPWMDGIIMKLLARPFHWQSYTLGSQ